MASFHPEWDSATDKSLDSCPICIPPSWDLVQKYVGALDENADGFNKDFYEKGRRYYVGDHGEAEFLDLMRNSNIGGILIGDVNSQHLLYGHELSNNDKEYYMLPSQVTRRLKKLIKQSNDKKGLNLNIDY